MENYIVDLDGDGFSADEFADIKKCLETLLSVRAGSQPLDREFGIDVDHVLGYPLNIARNMLALEIIEKVRIYETRVEADNVWYEENTDGKLIPHVHFVKAEV